MCHLDDFSSTIWQLRREKRWTQAEFAEKLRISPHERRLRKHARDKSDTLCYSLLREEWENGLNARKMHEREMLQDARKMHDT